MKKRKAKPVQLTTSAGAIKLIEAAAAHLKKGIVSGPLPVATPEMADRLGKIDWQRGTPLGGQYNWENNQMHGGIRYRAAICISESATAPLEVNAEMLIAIDKVIDDGNLSSGNFRTGINKTTTRSTSSCNERDGFRVRSRFQVARVLILFVVAHVLSP